LWLANVKVLKDRIVLKLMFIQEGFEFKGRSGCGDTKWRMKWLFLM